MKNLVGLVVVALLAVGMVRVISGCHRSEAAKAHKVCEQIKDLCGPEMAKDGITFTDHDMEECSSDLATKAPKELGSAYNDFVDCSIEANTCMELAGCLGGAMARRSSDKELFDLGRGFSKMMNR
jgi:hypothetical protein